MSAPVSPLRIADLGQARLRFFRSPAPQPDLPWHVHADLAACLGLPRSLRRHFARALVNGPFGKDVRAIATPDGIVTIAPHYAAQGLIGAAIETNGVPASFEAAYAKAAAAAMSAITAGWPAQAKLDYALTAARHVFATGGAA